ncbi:MAG: nickel-responsive transcriptional regulator NikR [Desulfobulbaceae bacterium]|nr:nickel-responsive transcriptional regulator NikR [Desulfobulbaceae bacterium]
MLKRFTVSLEDDLLVEFDSYIKSHQYNNRSEAIRDLIRKSLIMEEWEAGKEVVGVISLVYDHHQYQLQERITELQHDFHHQIISATHIHMDHDNCLEVIIVRGMAAKVKELAAKLSAIRGVKDGTLNMSSTGGDLH